MLEWLQKLFSSDSSMTSESTGVGPPKPAKLDPFPHKFGAMPPGLNPDLILYLNADECELIWTEMKKNPMLDRNAYARLLIDNRERSQRREISTSSSPI